MERACLCVTCVLLACEDGTLGLLLHGTSVVGFCSEDAATHGWLEPQRSPNATAHCKFAILVFLYFFSFSLQLSPLFVFLVLFNFLLFSSLGFSRLVFCFSSLVYFCVRGVLGIRSWRSTGGAWPPSRSSWSASSRPSSRRDIERGMIRDDPAAGNGRNGEGRMEGKRERNRREIEEK